MAIYKRGGVYWYEFHFRGERVRESSHVANKAAALQIMAAHRVRLAKGEAGIVEKRPAPTLREFAKDFTKAIEADCAACPATVAFYRSKLQPLLAYEPLASRRLDAVNEAAIDAFVEHRSRVRSRRKRPLSPASINRELATLRRMLRLAYRRKLIDRVPKIELLAGEREREFVLSPAQEAVYLSIAPADLRDLAVLMLDTGLRMREALHLEWPNVHLEPAAGASLGYLRVTSETSKGKKSRNVPLTARTAEMLRGRGVETAGYVFRGADGGPLSQTLLNQQHARLRRTLKLPSGFVPHSFRHTYGTRLGEAGADAFTIMRLMGHSSVTVSQRYVHPTPEAMERAVQKMEALNRGETGKVPTIFTTVEKEQKAKRTISA